MLTVIIHSKKICASLGLKPPGSFDYPGSGVSPLTLSLSKGRLMVRQAHHERVALDNRKTRNPPANR